LRRWLNVCLCLIPLGLPASIRAQQTTPASTPVPTGAPWSYYGKTGPSSWGHLDPQYSACSKGKMQSPIDIRGAKVDPSLRPIEFHYLSGPLTLVNTGHTVRVNVVPGGYIVYGGVRYDLVEFHFHHPAEDLANGKLSDLQIDMVHKNAAGELAIIGVRVNEGVVNGSLAALWPSLPQTAGATSSIQDNFNPLGLLPSDRRYWSYVGSITVPPCTEGVHWISMQSATELSQDQWQAFAKLYPDSARQIQPMNKRKIGASQ